MKKVRLLAGLALLLVLMYPSGSAQAAQWHSYPVELQKLTAELNQAYMDGEDLVFNTRIKAEDMRYFLQYAVSTSVLEFEDEWTVGTDGEGNGFLYISRESVQNLCCHYEETSQIMQDIYLGFSFTDEGESGKADQIGGWIYDNITVDGKCGSDSLYEVLLSKTSDCRGIAVLYKNLCDMAGLPCQIVSGRNKGGPEVHLWNRVQLDGSWVSVDVSQQLKGQELLEYHTEEDYYQ